MELSRADFIYLHSRQTKLPRIEIIVYGHFLEELIQFTVQRVPFFAGFDGFGFFPGKITMYILVQCVECF